MPCPNITHVGLSTFRVDRTTEFVPLLPRHRALPVSVAPAQSRCELHRWEVATPPTSTSVVHPACPAVPATLRASPEPNSAALRTVKRHRISCRTSGSRRSCLTRARQLNPSLRVATAKAPNTFRPALASLPQKLSGRGVAPSSPCAAVSPHAR